METIFFIGGSLHGKSRIVNDRFVVPLPNAHDDTDLKPTTVREGEKYVLFMNNVYILDSLNKQLE